MGERLQKKKIQIKNKFMENTNEKGNVAIILILIAVVLVAIYLFRQNPKVVAPGSDIVVYPVQCDDWFTSSPPESKDITTCHQKRALDRIAFKVDKEKQQVIQWSPEDSIPSYETNNDCTIIDLNNWGCNDGAISAFGLKNGNYYQPDLTNVIFTSMASWELINNGKPTR